MPRNDTVAILNIGTFLMTFRDPQTTFLQETMLQVPVKKIF
jgi:hypothetical protein